MHLRYSFCNYYVYFYIYVAGSPHWQVAQFKIDNSLEIANLENSYRLTLA